MDNGKRYGHDIEDSTETRDTERKRKRIVEDREDDEEREAEDPSHTTRKKDEIRPPPSKRMGPIATGMMSTTFHSNPIPMVEEPTWNSNFLDDLKTMGRRKSRREDEGKDEMDARKDGEEKEKGDKDDKEKKKEHKDDNGNREDDKEKKRNHEDDKGKEKDHREYEKKNDEDSRIATRIGRNGNGNGNGPTKKMGTRKEKGSIGRIKTMRDRIRFSGDQSMDLSVLQASNRSGIWSCICSDPEGRIVKMQCYLGGVRFAVGDVYSFKGCRCKHDEEDSLWTAIAHRDYGTIVERLGASDGEIREKRSRYDPYISAREAADDRDEDRISIFGILCEDPFVTQIGRDRKWMLRMLDRELAFFKVHWDEIDGRIAESLKEGQGVGLVGVRRGKKRSDMLYCDRKTLIITDVPCGRLKERIRTGDIPPGKIVGRDERGQPIDERMILDPYHINRLEHLDVLNWKDTHHFVNDVRCKLQLCYTTSKDVAWIDVVRTERKDRPVIMTLPMYRKAMALPPETDFNDPEALASRLTGREFCITVKLFPKRIKELNDKVKIEKSIHCVKEC